MLTGEQLDGLAQTAMKVQIVCLVVGVVGGLLTYVIPLTPRREREIRSYCAELLLIAVDPAQVPAHNARSIEQYASDPLPDELARQPQGELIRQLVLVRARIGQNRDAVRMEQQTDILLERLRQVVPA
jgi:hypothetical protein